MKRMLSLFLALVLALSLVGCGKTEPTKKDDLPNDISQEEKGVDVTAEELLLTNYGVDELQSMTLGLLIEVTSDEYTGRLGGMFEQTEEMFHLIIDEITSGTTESPLYYDIYYDIKNETLYRFDSEAGWVKSIVPDYDMGFNRLSSIPAPNLVDGALVSEGAMGYLVTGTTSNGVVADLMSFMFEDNDLTYASVSTCFTYDKDSRLLKNMHWEAEQDGTKFVIDADVTNINATSFIVPFDMELVPFEGVDTDGDELDEYIAGRLEGEQLMSEVMFSTDYVGESDFLAGIPEQYRNLHEGVLYITRWWFNSYSREGFIRMVSSSKPEIEEELSAAVLVCTLADIPYEYLWQGGFMSESEAKSIMSVLVGIEG